MSHPSRLCGLAIGAALVLAAADQPRFEEASVKPAERCSLRNSVDPGLVVLDGDPLNLVLREAFGVRMDQIAGPAWMEDDCFTIRARIPQGVGKDQIPAMLQTLLTERFKLAFHRQNRPQSGYVLALDKNGPKFKETDPNSPEAIARAGQTTFRSTPGTAGIKGSMTMTAFTRYLSNRLHSQVEDQTGLKGKYDVDLVWAPDRSLDPMGPFARATAAAHPDLVETDLGVDLFTAIRESLGLRLEARKESVEIIVIDHLERIPADN